ncbi:hypothetical protein CsSME_00006423 [Camellia sinensis var. sinensis]
MEMMLEEEVFVDRIQTQLFPISIIILPTVSLVPVAKIQALDHNHNHNRIGGCLLQRRRRRRIVISVVASTVINKDKSCNFFVWCDKVWNDKITVPVCRCFVGPCSIYKEPTFTRSNVGRYFFVCPIKKENV